MLIAEIIEGHTNLLLNRKKELDEVRLEICQQCVPFFLPNNRCMLCKCNMAAKRRATKSKCPKGKWWQFEQRSYCTRLSLKESSQPRHWSIAGLHWLHWTEFVRKFKTSIRHKHMLQFMLMKQIAESGDNLDIGTARQMIYHYLYYHKRVSVPAVLRVPIASVENFERMVTVACNYFTLNQYPC